MQIYSLPLFQVVFLHTFRGKKNLIYNTVRVFCCFYKIFSRYHKITHTKSLICTFSNEKLKYLKFITRIYNFNPNLHSHFHGQQKAWIKHRIEMCHFSIFIGYLLQILVCVHFNFFTTGHWQKAGFCAEMVETVGKVTATIHSFLCKHPWFVSVRFTAQWKINRFIITSESC